MKTTAKQTARETYETRQREIAAMLDFLTDVPPLRGLSCGRLRLNGLLQRHNVVTK